MSSSGGGVRGGALVQQVCSLRCSGRAGRARRVACHSTQTPTPGLETSKVLLCVRLCSTTVQCPLTCMKYPATNALRMFV